MELNLFPDLLNLQLKGYNKEGKIDQTALAVITTIYPIFKVVSDEYSIYEDEPFIYIGPYKALDSVTRRPESHVCLGPTGEYDLTDRDVLIDLAYKHHNKKRPQYLDDIDISSWSVDKFLYNWKYLWLLGKIPDATETEDRRFLDVLSRLDNPFSLLVEFMRITEDSDMPYLDNALLTFIQKSESIDLTNTRGKRMLQYRQMFYTNYRTRVPYAVRRLLDSPIDNPTLRSFNFLKDTVLGDVKL